MAEAEHLQYTNCPFQKRVLWYQYNFILTMWDYFNAVFVNQLCFRANSTVLVQWIS